MRLRSLWPLILTLACAAGPSVRPVNAALESIGRLERTRSLGDGALEQLAHGADQPELRARALLALARIQALSTAPTVIQALADPQPSVRGQAAFAAGELAQAWEPVPDAVRDALGAAVVAAEAREDDSGARRFELEALGKLATGPALEALAKRLAAPDAKEVARAALSLGVAARQKHPLPDAAWAGWVHALRVARWPAAAALANTRDPRARAPLEGLLQDADPQVRAVAVKGLAELKSDADLPRFARALGDADGRVAAEAVRGLVQAAARCNEGAPCPALSALQPLADAPGFLGSPQSARGSLPLLAFAQSPLPDALRALAVSLRRAIDETAFGAGPGSAASGMRDAAGAVVLSEAKRRDLGRLDCRLAAAIDRIDGRLAAVRTCGLDAVPLARRLTLGLNAIAEGPHFAARASVPQLAEALQDPDASVRLAAVNALGQTKNPEAAARVRPLIASDDLIVAADAAAAAGELQDVQAIPLLVALIDRLGQRLPEEGDPVASAVISLHATQAIPALQRWLKAPHANLRINAAKALTALTGKPVAVPVVAQDDRLQPVPAMGTSLRVKTERGVFDLRLRPDLAPQTSANFAALAHKGFFNGLTFHRIVPDFVVQGGDPRGDGEGGPGYTLPCEINSLGYDRGVVGVALSGKDTGGSQFFVTTSPQPHLDGRYTAFGQVTAGMDVVDALLEGDRILGVDVIPPST